MGVTYMRVFNRKCSEMTKVNIYNMLQIPHILLTLHQHIITFIVRCRSCRIFNRFRLKKGSKVTKAYGATRCGRIKNRNISNELEEEIIIYLFIWSKVRTPAKFIYLLLWQKQHLPNWAAMGSLLSPVIANT